MDYVKLPSSLKAGGTLMYERRSFALLTDGEPHTHMPKQKIDAIMLKLI
jgi:hypothetical protein